MPASGAPATCDEAIRCNSGIRTCDLPLTAYWLDAPRSRATDATGCGHPCPTPVVHQLRASGWSIRRVACQWSGPKNPCESTRFWKEAEAGATDPTTPPNSHKARIYGPFVFLSRRQVSHCSGPLFGVQTCKFRSTCGFRVKVSLRNRDEPLALARACEHQLFLHG